MSTEARGYSWPPFENGNTASLRHGATSARVVGPLADRIATEIISAAPWLDSPAQLATVRAAAWAEAQLLVLRAYIDEKGLLTDKGAPQPATDYLERVESKAARLRERCGLDVTAWAKLLATLTASAGPGEADQLEAVRAEGRRIVAARTAQLARPDESAALPASAAQPALLAPQVGSVTIAPGPSAEAPEDDQEAR